MLQIIQIQNGCNCYIVQQGDKAVLIDTGLNNKSEKIIKLCREKNVKLIILTHGHMDHIQCAAKVSKTLNIPIAMHQDDYELIEDNLRQPMHGRGILGKILSFFSKISVKTGNINHLEVTEFLEEGHITQFGLELQIVTLPGHTKGSIGIKIKENFFVGDALMNMTSPGISLLYENMDDLKESAKKISDMGDITIYFGHGKSVANREWIS